MADINNLQSEVQTEIVKILINKLNKVDSETENENSLFIAGYLINESQDDFSFTVQDPTNDYRRIKKEFVPTYFDDFNGSLQPIKSVYDEAGTLGIQFAIYADKKAKTPFEDVLNKISNFKTSINATTDSFIIKDAQNEDVTFYYKFVGSPLTSPRGGMTLGGRPVVFQLLSLDYGVSTNPYGDANSYRIKLLNESPTEFITLPEFTRTMGKGTNADGVPTADLEEAEYTGGATVWSKTSAIYTLASAYVNSSGVLKTTFRDSLFKYLTDKTSNSETVYTMEINIDNGNNQSFRNVIIDSIGHSDALGTPEVLTVSFKEAKQELVEEQTVVV